MDDREFERRVRMAAAVFLTFWHRMAVNHDLPIGQHMQVRIIIDKKRKAHKRGDDHGHQQAARPALLSSYARHHGLSSSSLPAK